MSIEAEYIAILEVAMEILFIAGVMKFIGMDVAYSIKVNVDNIGAICLSKNVTTGNQTKRVNMRFHFVCKYINNSKLKIMFVRSEENHADLITKNLSTELYRKHTNGMFKI